jgi:hypothetical protein
MCCITSSLNPTLLQVLNAHRLEVRRLCPVINSRINSFLQDITLQTDLSSTLSFIDKLDVESAPGHSGVRQALQFGNDAWCIRCEQHFVRA